MATAADPLPYLAASAVSSTVTFPFWKAAVVGQSGYALTSTSALGRFWEAARPPWRGALVVVSGMTWGRAAILFGSDEGSRWLVRNGWGAIASTALPPVLISAYVQVACQPLMRSSIMLQGDPQVRFAAESRTPIIAVMRHLCRTKGVGALWRGTGVGLMRTVPKYVVTIAAKNAMEGLLPPADGGPGAVVVRSAKKGLAAGVLGSVITNPFDVAQNEMFKTEESLPATVRRLCREEGSRWMLRGCSKNVVASAMPMACTIFLTDAFSSLSWPR